MTSSQFSCTHKRKQASDNLMFVYISKRFGKYIKQVYQVISKRFGVYSWIMMKYAIKVKSLTTKISDSYIHEINSWRKKYLFSTNYKLHNESLKDLKSKSLRFTLVIYNIKNCVKALSWRHNTNPKIQAALPLCKVRSWNTKV